MVDEGSKPIAVALSPGSTHDSKMFNHLYDKRRRKPGRIYGGSAYDTDEIRDRLERDGVKANIPVNPRNGQIPYDEKEYKGDELYRLQRTIYCARQEALFPRMHRRAGFW